MSRLDHRAVLSQIHRLAGGLALDDCADGDLLERFRRRRDEAAFAVLVRRHGAMVMGVCRRVLGDRHDAEDAFQATFLVLARKAGSIRRAESLGIWLHRVARQLALRARANRDRRQKFEHCGLPANGAGLKASNGIELADELSLREALLILDEEIGRLPDNLRGPVVLCYLQGRTNEEAARDLGCAAGTLKTRLGRARELLGRRLTGRGVALSIGAAAVLMLAPGASEALCASVARAAVAFAVHETTCASGAAIQLAHQLLRTMTMNRIKLWAIGLLTLALIGTSAGTLVRQRVWGGAPPATTPVAATSGTEPGEQPKAKTDVHGDPLPPGAVARLGTIRWRHGSQASVLAFAAGGKEVVTAGPDGLIKVWDAATGKELRRLGKPGESGAADVSYVSYQRPSALSADGKWAATWDDGIRVWDVGAGKELRRFEIEKKEDLFAIALTPDGKGLLTSSLNGKMILWDVATGKEKRSFEVKGMGDVPPVGVSGVTFSPDGKWLAAPMFETMVAESTSSVGVRLWDVATGKEVRTIGSPLKGDNVIPVVAYPAFSSDSKTIARPLPDGTVCLHNTSDGKEQRTLGKANQEEAIVGMTFAPDGKALAVLLSDGRVHVYDTGNGKKLHTLAEGPPRPATPTHSLDLGNYSPDAPPLAFSPDGKTLALVPGENAVRLWDLTTGKPLPCPTGHTGIVADLAVSADGKVVVTHGSDDTLRRWELTTGKELGRLAVPGEGLVVALSPTGRLLAYTDDTTLRVWDVAAKKDVLKIELPMDPNGVVARTGTVDLAKFSPNEKVLVTGDLSGAVHLWDVATGKELHKLTAGKEIEAGAAQLFLQEFSGDGRMLLTGCLMNTVVPLAAQPGAQPPAMEDPVSVLCLWDPAAGVLLRRWEAKGIVRSAAFTPDGRAVVTISAERVTVWEVATGGERFHIKGSHGAAALVSCSPDGRFVACVAGATVRLLDLRTGEECGRLKGHEADVWSLAFTRDGKKLISGSADSTALVWDAARLVPPAPKIQEQAAERLDELWADLKSDDAGKAFRAMVVLEASPKSAAALLAKRVKSAEAPDAKQLKKWVADLDNDNFEAREKATTELARLGELARPALEAAMMSKSAEARRRAEELLGGLKPDAAMAAEDVRSLRAVEVLARINTPEARQALKALARGPEGDRVVREAKAILERLDAHAP
jgi:RNA polymerase sigma factor (sigma-70 family)